MVARYLITTADERTWRTDCPVLFLGEWCRVYNRRTLWEKLDAVVAPYHWDDRPQLYRDYCYLRDLYEMLLAEVSEALNSFHGVQHSLRYWRILIGPWLGYFTQMVFDRWCMVQYVARNETIEDTTILALPPDQVIPNDMAHFDQMFVGDLWNHHIYGRIITEWTDLSYTQDEIPATSTADLVVPSQQVRMTWQRRVRRLGAQWLVRLSGIMSRPKDVFFQASYLPLNLNLALQVALGQMPKFWHTFAQPQVAHDPVMRQRFQLDASAYTGFDACVRSLICEQIPILYLEGYGTLTTATAQLPWPKRPRIIFTSNSANSNDLFKAWAASKVEQGHRLVIGQHGGHYGTGLWSFIEEHETAIADRYLTWGWKDGDPRHYPIGALKLLGKGDGAWSVQGGLLLVTSVVPRYSYWMYSIVVAGQTGNYLDDQLQFAASLPQPIRQQLLVRLYSTDYGWGQQERWRDRFPEVRLDPGIQKIEPLIRQSRLYIATYNATTFLETLGRNIPTIMFWNPAHWELRHSAIPYFDQLQQVGIFHTTPEAAAAQVATVWDDVLGWWNRAEIQAARRSFCERFAYLPKSPVRAMKNALIEIAAESVECKL